jgi:hypothetical protein
VVEIRKALKRKQIADMDSALLFQTGIQFGFETGRIGLFEKRVFRAAFPRLAKVKPTLGAPTGNLNVQTSVQKRSPAGELAGPGLVIARGLFCGCFGSGRRGGLHAHLLAFHDDLHRICVRTHFKFHFAGVL